MITVVDYGMGNLRSVYNALSLLGQDVCITSQPADILTAERLILSGVGAFGLAMLNLRQRGLIDPLNEKVLRQKTPLLAICLGMQLLADSSNEHGQHDGLGWVGGRVRNFEGIAPLRVPHVGWNTLRIQQKSPLLEGISAQDPEFYFVHSFHFTEADPAHVVATAHYGYDFPCVVQKDNIFGTQFHPEKSQANGLQLLRNFLKWQPTLAKA